jgi:hypothetical protein
MRVDLSYNRATVEILTHVYISIHSFTGAYSPGWTFGLPFRGFLITHTYRHTAGLLWTSDQPVAETFTYTGQHNIYTQQTNIHATSVIGTRDPSNEAAADLSLRPCGHWHRLFIY